MRYYEHLFVANTRVRAFSGWKNTNCMVLATTHSRSQGMRLPLISGVCLIVMSLHALAATQAQRYFDQGMEKYREGEYSLALNGFNSAIAAGMDVPAVYYNLAVCYYRIGAYAQAEANFRQTARFPDMKALAYYNLGLVSIRQEDASAAADWLHKSQQVNTDEKLAKLITAALAEVEGGDVRSEAEELAGGYKWSGVIFASAGYDDNVTLDNTDLVLVSGQSAAVVELFANTESLLSGNSDDGLLFKGSIYANINEGHHDINIAELDGGLYLAQNIGEWRNEYGLSLSHSTLGGAPYLNDAALRLSTDTRLSATLRLDLRLRVRVIRSSDVLYEPLDGTSQDIRIAGKWRPAGDHDIKLYYQMYNNDRNNLETATRYYSYSYTSHSIRADYRYTLTSRYTLRTSAEFRTSNYKDENIEADGARILRNDERIRLLLGLDYRLSRDALLGVKYEYTNNSSNIDRYDYISNFVLATWMILY